MRLSVLRRALMGAIAAAALIPAGCRAAASGGPAPACVQGWDLPRLEAAFQTAAEMGSTTLLVVTNGRTVRAMGDLSRPYRVHSVRKALLSALVGQHLGSGPGRIDLDRTLAELDIDDAPLPLTPLQKQATVKDLIRSVSGINHPAAGEIGAMTAAKHQRLGAGPVQPGTVWAYNNWDYNALTTIFEKVTGRRVYEAFLTGIARPLGMQDYGPGSVAYTRDRGLSIHAKAGFRMSARDLARFGQLYLDQGRVNGRQVIPAAWVARVTGDFTRTGESGIRSGHGYLWWVPCDGRAADLGIPAGTFVASGFAGQRIVVIPAWRTVIVHQVSTDDYEGLCRDWARHQGFDLDQAAAYARGPCRTAAHRQELFCRYCRYFTGADVESLLARIIRARETGTAGRSNSR